MAQIISMNIATYIKTTFSN